MTSMTDVCSLVGPDAAWFPETRTYSQSAMEYHFHSVSPWRLVSSQQCSLISCFVIEGF